MAFGRLQRSAAAQPMSDINLTPLIDVVLVLLVIFMITAPLMTSSLKLDLPRTEGAKPTDAAQFVTLAIDPQGRFFWGDEQVGIDALRLRVREAALRNPATEVQLRADRTVTYGRVAELIGIVQEGGLSRVGFVTEASPEKPR
ncbi:MAG: Biopolymer transport protein ExbD [Burkholderiaceae bacterium]|nr:Biopolymer transport protein ExbD [Burkholderiaceae bacterium]